MPKLVKLTIDTGNEPDIHHRLASVSSEFDGQLCHITIGTYQNKTVVKKQSVSQDSDWYLRREMAVVKRMRKLGPTHFSKYLPKPVGDTYTDSGRQTNMFEKAEGYYTLDEVIAQYPEGIPAEDIAWIGNRLFEIVNYAHRLNIIHGCINTSNFLINPETHGGILIDWCYSSNYSRPIRLIVESERASYPPEVRAKRRAGERTDIYMIAKTLLKLVNKDTCPPKFINFLKSLCIEAYQYRPSGSNEQMLKFKSIQEDLFGPPSFHPFSMSPSSTT